VTKDTLEAIKAALAVATLDERRRVFENLRKEFSVHELEQKWNVSAEVVLEAIARATDLTQRGLRGVIAEATFRNQVVAPLVAAGWQDNTPAGDIPFDYSVEDAAGRVRVQVKNQRSERKVPKLWKGNAGVFVVETQKTRAGKDKGGKDTRPYRFGEFDILAVCLHPSTGKWEDFLYTVGNWLLPRKGDKKLVAVLQPVDPGAKQDWTPDFATAVSWYRAAKKKTIAAPSKAPRARKPK